MENAQGVTQLISQANDDAAAFLAENNRPELTEAQRGAFVAALTPRVPGLLAECEQRGLDEAMRRVMALALTLDVLTEVVWGRPCAVMDPRFTGGLDLAVTAASRANELITAGGYPSFTEAQRNALVQAICKRATSLVSSGRSMVDCEAELLVFVQTAVGVLMGPAPARAHLN